MRPSRPTSRPVASSLAPRGRPPRRPQRSPRPPRALSPPDAPPRVQEPPPPGQLAPTGYAVADWAAAFDSQLGEFSYAPRVDGALPPWLVGTLFRNGPARFERGGRRYAHMLDGDGYVTAFTFKQGGSVHFRGRFVRTAEAAAEEYADRVLYRGSFGTAPPGGALTNALRLHIKNASNTHAVAWGGRLLSLWEAGAPYELDPATLATRPAPPTLGGLVVPGIAPSTTGIPALDSAIGLGSALTAHPHVVPPPATDTGRAPNAPPPPRDEWRLATWAWRSRMTAAGPELHIETAEFDRAWNRTARGRVTLPRCAFNPHDVAITPTSYVFFQAATSLKLAPYLLGVAGPAQCVEVGGSQGATVWVAPRHGRGAAAVVSVPADPVFLVHHAAAWEDDASGDIVVWSTGWGPDALAKIEAGGGVLGSWRVVLDGDFDDIPYTSLWEHRINVAAGTVTRRALFDAHAMEHAKTNPRLATRPARHVWFTQAVSAVRGVAAPPQAFTHVDTATGATSSYAPGRRCFTEEVVFVPRPGAPDPADDPAAETDGVLLAMVFDAATRTSALHVLDAANVAAGPIARVQLDHHVPHGLHGDWTEDVWE